MPKQGTSYFVACQLSNPNAVMDYMTVNFLLQLHHPGQNQNNLRVKHGNQSPGPVTGVGEIELYDSAHSPTFGPKIENPALSLQL